MSYRIYLNLPTESPEIWDETPIYQLKKVNIESQDEYPDYIVDKEGMEMILNFYKKKLYMIAKECLKDSEKMKSKILFWDSVASYFNGNKLETNDSSSFFIQYFYLLDIYKNTNRDSSTFTISHG